MTGTRTTKCNDFSVTVDGCLLIFATVMAEMAFHEPCLGVMRIDVQNAVDEYLGNFPPFFRNCPRRVCTVDANLRISVTNI